MRGRAIGLLNEFLKPKAKLTRPLINPAIPCKDILNFHFSFHSVNYFKEFIFKDGGSSLQLVHLCIIRLFPRRGLTRINESAGLRLLAFPAVNTNLF
jgi:hypothetical protein